MRLTNGLDPCWLALESHVAFTATQRLEGQGRWAENTYLDRIGMVFSANTWFRSSVGIRGSLFGGLRRAHHTDTQWGQIRGNGETLVLNGPFEVCTYPPDSSS
jgi:hypothetical protein